MKSILCACQMKQTHDYDIWSFGENKMIIQRKSCISDQLSIDVWTREQSKDDNSYDNETVNKTPLLFEQFLFSWSKTNSYSLPRQSTRQMLDESRHLLSYLLAYAAQHCLINRFVNRFRTDVVRTRPSRSIRTSPSTLHLKERFSELGTMNGFRQMFCRWEWLDRRDWTRCFLF